MLAEKAAGRLALILLIGYLLLAANLIRMQVVRGGYYYSLSERNRIRVIFLEGPRGKLLDRSGRVLAANRLSFNCSAFPKDAKPGLAESCRILSPILGVEARRLEERFRRKKPGAYNTVIIEEDLHPSQAMAIEEKLDLLPGFLIETRPQREYPYGAAAAHLTGTIGPLTEQEYDALETMGYRQADWTGREGVEQSYESYLRGRSGGLQMEVDNRGQLIKPLGVKEPKEGRDVQLTVDAELQEFAQSLLEGQKGAVAIMELDEGGLLSVNSAPSFDPNLFASGRGRREVGRYLEGRGSPMINRLIQGKFPPGSIFKIVTALAAFDRKRIGPGTAFVCPGFKNVGGKIFHCWREQGHGPQDAVQAFAHSCNVFFYTAGILAGADALFEKATALGLDRATGVDLPSERKGFVPSRQWKRLIRRESWYEGETANFAIGQGQLQITPIEALVMIAGVAKDGQLYRPHVIDRIDGRKAAERHTRYVDLGADLATVKKGLEEVVQSETGTGRLARAEGVRVAGKTGTAQSGQARTHAWFIGYAPAEDPKVAMVVFLEHGGRGGVAAAAIASKLFGRLKEAGYL